MEFSEIAEKIMGAMAGGVAGTLAKAGLDQWLKRGEKTAPALAALAANPGDSLNQTDLKTAICGRLRDEPGALAEIQALLDQLPDRSTVTQTQTVGAGGKAGQNAGNNNAISIG